MKTRQCKPAHMLAAAMVIGALGVNLNATAAPAQDNQQTEHGPMQHQQEWTKARLAERLEIQPAQQDAWQAYVDAVESQAHDARQQSSIPTDAAGIARRRADLAADHAAKLMKIAEATASLEAVLTPEQRQKFDRMAQHAYRHDHRGGHRPAREDGPQSDTQPAAPAYQ